MEETRCASENLSERKTCTDLPEPEAFVETGSGDIAKLRANLDGFHPLAGEPVKRGRTRSPGDTSPTSPFGGGDQDDDSAPRLAVSPAGHVTGDAIFLFGHDHCIGCFSETAVPCPVFVDLVGNRRRKCRVGMKAVKDESGSTDFKDLRQVLWLE